MLRKAIEILSRGKSIKRHLPAEFGNTPLYVSPDAQLKYLTIGTKAFDSELLNIISSHIREDSTVWDIGANVGVFAFGAASIAKKGSTLAVEADIWLAQLMRKSLLLKPNQNLNLTILPAAIADKNGIATFLIASRGRASNSLESVGGRTQSGGFREKVTVPTLTLDTLLESFPAPSFVKVDVEGAEGLLLKGADKLLKEIRPLLYIEVDEEHNQEVTAILQGYGYSLFDGAKPLEGQSPANECAFNTLAMPN